MGSSTIGRRGYKALRRATKRLRKGVGIDWASWLSSPVQDAAST
jgi:hypothetical protein